MPLQPHKDNGIVYDSRFLLDLAEAYTVHVGNAIQFGNTPMVALLTRTQTALTLYSVDLADPLNVRLPPPEPEKENAPTS